MGSGGPITHPGNAPTAGATSAASLSTAVEEALTGAGIGSSRTSIERVHIATTAAIEELRDAAHTLLGAVEVDAGPDIDIVLATGARSTGIALAAGTGVVARAVGPMSERTVGGWGWLLGDEGSAYWMGAEAIRAAVRASEHRGPATVLSRLVPEALGAATLRELFDAVHTGDISRPSIAALGAIVARQTSTDDIARDIVDRAASELALLVRAARLAVVDAPPVLVTAGGVLAADGPVRAALISRLALTEPDLEVRHAIVPMAIAAALLAARQVDPETVANARTSMARLHSQGRTKC